MEKRVYQVFEVNQVFQVHLELMVTLDKKVNQVYAEIKVIMDFLAHQENVYQ